MRGFSGALLLQLELGFWPFTLGLGALGWTLGKRRLSPTCTACTKVVPAYASRCEDCSATLVADILELADVFEAEEAYNRASRSGSQ
jgi:hypothetical protein